MGTSGQGLSNTAHRRPRNALHFVSAFSRKGLLLDWCVSGAKAGRGAAAHSSRVGREGGDAGHSSGSQEGLHS